MYTIVTIQENKRLGWLQIPSVVAKDYTLREGDKIGHGDYIHDHDIARCATIPKEWIGHKLFDHISLAANDHWTCWTKNKPLVKVFVPKSTFHSTPLPLP